MKNLLSHFNTLVEGSDNIEDALIDLRNVAEDIDSFVEAIKPVGALAAAYFNEEMSAVNNSLEPEAIAYLNTVLNRFDDLQRLYPYRVRTAYRSVPTTNTRDAKSP